MTTTKSGDWSSKAGSEARAITRGEEVRVRGAVAKALGVDVALIDLYWSHADRLASITLTKAGIYCSLMADEMDAVRRGAGIVPGADGWCWAAPVADRAAQIRAILFDSLGPADGADPERINWDDLISDLRRGGVDGPGLDEVTAVLRAMGARSDGPGWILERRGAPPAWLTAAVLAALPADGTPVKRDAAFHKAIDAAAGKAGVGWTLGMVDDALDAMTTSGEIEYVGDGAWRRWGVPEGAGWGEPVNGIALLVGLGTNVVGRVEETGEWWAYPGEGGRAFAWGTASPPTLTAARSAALRACYERGMFAPAAASKPAPSPPTDPAATRPARLRAALLAVLTRGPVLTTSALLPALDAAMGERAGVAVARGEEAMRAAREVGARVDGVEWSLPPIPDGWGWRPWQGDGLFLAPLGASNVADASIAMAASEWWEMYKPGPGGEVIEQAPCANREEGQAAALQAARLAGLFAAPRAEVAAPVTPAPVEAPAAPLDALLALLSRVSRGPLDHGTVQASGAFIDAVVAAARLPVDPIHRAAIDAYAAHRRARSAPLASEELSDAEAEVARTTGALFDLLDGAAAGDAIDPAADARHAQRIAENERDAARADLAAMTALYDETARGWGDQSHKAADAERSLGFARQDLEVARGALAAAQRERDEALATVERVRERLEPVLAAIAGGRPGAVAK